MKDTITPVDSEGYSKDGEPKDSVDQDIAGTRYSGLSMENQVLGSDGVRLQVASIFASVKNDEESSV